MVVGDINQSGSWGKCRGLPVLGAGGCRAQAPYHFSRDRLLLLNVLKLTGLQVHPTARRNGSEDARRQDFSRRAIYDVDIAVTIRMYQNLPGLSVNRKIEKDVFVYSVIVVKIVRAELVKPHRLARVGIAREDAGRKFIVTRTSLRVPRSWVRGAVVNQIELRVIRNPAPHATAANFPCVGRPTLHAQVLASILRVEWFESRADQNIFIRPRAIGFPGDLAALFVERCQPTPNPEFTSTVSNEDFSFYNKRSHGQALALVDVSNTRFPYLLAGGRVNGYCLIVERVVLYFPIVIGSASIDHVTACNSL